MFRGSEGAVLSRALRTKYRSIWLEGKGLWLAHPKVAWGGEVLGPLKCDQELGLHSESRVGSWADLSLAIFAVGL